MRRRVLTFLLTGLVVLGSVFGCIPMRASGIIPLGFVQSALASYVSSTGYKLYNDNGTGQDILGSLGELYDDYVTVSNKTITGQLANLAFLANSPYIYQDNSGQIVVSKVAADIFQDFADWIQTEYSVTVGSDTPTTVLSPSLGGDTIVSGSASGITYPISFTRSDLIHIHTNTRYGYFTFITSAPVNAVTVTFNESTWLFVSSTQPFSFGLGSDATDYPTPSFSGEGYLTSSYGNPIYSASISSRSGAFISANVPNAISTTPNDNLFSVLRYEMIYGNVSSSPGIVGLGVTLAQAVADVVGQAKEDDAVVIGVGASAGATAQDIADMVAQGVKAQTLDPSVSITAESVIDTPVQPYPDIDGLGLPELGAALVSRFPFCIPWDFVDTVKLLNADPVAPDIAVDLFPAAFKSKVGISGSTEFRINLGDEKYQKIGVFCRWGSLIGFCFGLAMLTKRMIWTA